MSKPDQFRPKKQLYTTVALKPEGNAEPYPNKQRAEIGKLGSCSLDFFSYINLARNFSGFPRNIK